MNPIFTISKKGLAFIAGLLFFSASAHALTFKIIQFNTWGVPLMVEDCSRYSQAMERIESRSPDVVILEEVFTRKGKKAFHRESYPYEARGPRAFPKLVSSGLRILSRFPITRVSQTVFRRCTESDCLARKGAILVVLDLPDGQKLNVVATHLDSGKMVNVRLSQLKQIQTLIETGGEPGAATVFAGDLNFIEDSIEYPRMMSALGMTDGWRATHAVSDPGFTYDTTQNRYAHDYSIKTHEPPLRGRIDYVLSKDGALSLITPTDSKVIFNEEPLLSDHYGLETEFMIDSKNAAHLN